jgi:hypothetical protein
MRVYLYAFGFGATCDEFAKLMGAEPDRRTPQGDDWSYDSRLTDARDLEQHVIWLIERFEGVMCRAQSRLPQTRFQVNVCVEMAGNLAPAANLSRETLRRMAALDLSVDIDLYAFERDDNLTPLADYRCVIADEPER